MLDFRSKLANYRCLTARVDDLCCRIAAEYAESLSCREGCGDCCRKFTLFPVEAVAISCALDTLSAEESSYIRGRARFAANSEACPLLENGRCLLYSARPLICRTHGFPLITGGDGRRTIDFCPKNFMGVKSFPAAFLLDLDILNTTLAAINAVFLSSCNLFQYQADERLNIAEALLLKIHD